MSKTPLETYTELLRRSEQETRIVAPSIFRVSFDTIAKLFKRSKRHEEDSITSDDIDANSGV